MLSGNLISHHSFHYFSVMNMWICTGRRHKTIVRIFVVATTVFFLWKILGFNAVQSVPNVVHYVIFGETPINFIIYLSIVSVLKVQKPYVIQIHTDNPATVASGKYWESLMALSRHFDIPLVTSRLSKPTHVFGQKLSSVYHSSDVARILVLHENGGVYLDTDVLVLKPLDEFFKYDLTLSWSDKSTIGNQVLIAKKGARFLTLWLNGYKMYKPTMWYYNAGQYPAELLEENHSLIHRVDHSFGVQNLLKELYETENWTEWKNMHTLHLLSRHPPSPQNMDVQFIERNNKSFSKIARKLLFEMKPPLRPVDLAWER